MSRRLDIFTDGACSGNPGLGGIGVVVKEKGKTVKELSLGIGQTTNNVAEYTAAIYALQEALILRADEVVLHTDSELFYRHMKGYYKVKHPKIKLLFDQVRHLVPGFKKIDFKCIPRADNKDADGLAKKAIKKEQAKAVALTSSLCVGEESPSSKG